MNNAYNPTTLEHIRTDTPAPWMGLAETDAPEYNQATQGCFWRDGAWVVVESKTFETQAQIDALKAQIKTIERNDLMNRRAREGFIIEAEERAALPPYNLTPSQLYEVQPGYRGAKDVDNQCAALRAQIRALEDLL